MLCCDLINFIFGDYYCGNTFSICPLSTITLNVDNYDLTNPTFTYCHCNYLEARTTLVHSIWKVRREIQHRQLVVM